MVKYKVYTWGTNGSEHIDGFKTLNEAIDFAITHWVGFDKITTVKGEVIYNHLCKTYLDKTIIGLRR